MPDSIMPIFSAGLDFPANPNVGDVFMGWTWDGTKWIRTPVIPPAQLMVSVGPTPPGSPADGFLWWDSVGGNLYMWYVDATSSQWVIANVGIMGPTGAQGPPGPAVPAVNLEASVPTAADLPTTGNTAGDARITVDTGDLWVWDGTVWFNAGPIQGPPGVAGAPGPQGPAGPPGPVGEAPTDGQYYVRQGSTATWFPGLALAGGTMTGGLTMGDGTNFMLTCSGTSNGNIAWNANYTGTNWTYGVAGIAAVMGLTPLAPSELDLWMANAGAAGAAVTWTAMARFMPAPSGNSNVVINCNIGTAGGFNQTWNAISVAGTWEYVSTGPTAAATSAIQTDGSWTLDVAPPGTVGQPITFTQVLRATPALLTLGANQVSCPGQFNMGAGAGFVAGTPGIFLPAGSGVQSYQTSSWTGNIYSLIYMDTVGNINIGANGSPSGYIQFPAAVVLFNANGITLPNAASVWAYQNGSTIKMSLVWLDGNNNINIGGGTPVPFNTYVMTQPGSSGGGFNLPQAIPWANQSTWNVYSDPRVKVNTGTYSTGLAAIKQISPISYRYNGKAMTDDKLTHIGLDATALKSIMPEAVMSRKVQLNPSDAEETAIDCLKTDPLIYAMLNAIKELAAKVEALEAK